MLYKRQLKYSRLVRNGQKYSVQCNCIAYIRDQTKYLVNWTASCTIVQSNYQALIQLCYKYRH